MKLLHGKDIKTRVSVLLMCVGVVFWACSSGSRPPVIEQQPKTEQVTTAPPEKEVEARVDSAAVLQPLPLLPSPKPSQDALYDLGITILETPSPQDTAVMDANLRREVFEIRKLEKIEEEIASLREEFNRRLTVLEEQIMGKPPQAASQAPDTTAKIAALPLPLPAAGSRLLPEVEIAVEVSYKKALDQYYQRHYQQAIEGFQGVLSLAPRGKLAPNAQYWIGECYYGLKKYRKSLTEFQRVLAFGESYKADDAQIKIGYCYLKLGKSKEAEGAFQNLLQSYPKSEYVPQAMGLLKKLK